MLSTIVASLVVFSVAWPQAAGNLAGCVADRQGAALCGPHFVFRLTGELALGFGEGHTLTREGLLSQLRALADRRAR